MKLIVITGPTATGKSALAVSLAKKLGAEIVSADSMQIYRRMDIGTAKPTKAERQGVPHHMIDVVDPEESYSVARFVDEASLCIKDIFSRGKRPILAGGTGLYIDSLVSGRTFAPLPQTGKREELAEQYERFGGQPLLERLYKADPPTASRLHPNDKKRVLRALEVYLETGKPLSQYDEETKNRPPKYEIAKIILGFENREMLYARIDKRVDDMLALGLKEEVQALLDRGLSPDRHTAMQAIGYKELALALSGRATMDEAVATVKRESRRYAKRQITWFAKDQKAKRVFLDNLPEIEKVRLISTKFLGENGII